MKKAFAPELLEENAGSKRRVRYFLLMLAILFATVFITEELRLLGFPPPSLIMVYLLAVLIVTLVTPTYLYGIVAALAGAIAYDFLITEPRMGFSFTIGSPITLFTMLTATCITTTLIIQLKKQAQLATEREHRAQLLYEINQKLLAAGDAEAIIQLANEYLHSHLDCPAVFYAKDPQQSGEGVHVEAPGQDARAALFSSAEEVKRVHQIFYSGEQPENLLGETGVYYAPVVSKGRVLGVIGVACGRQALGEGGRTFVQILAWQAALALDLQRLYDEKSRILVDAEKEKMRSTFLRSISHDLRTPLTGILGASSAILEEKDMSAQTKESLVKDIKENAGWLIRMVENILTVTKISEETMRVHKTLEAAEEVVSEAVAIVRKRSPDCLIHARIPENVLMVPMDATLISQVIINLLENAAKNSPEGSLILVNLKKEGSWAQFEVCDHGNGIPESLLDNLFEIRTSSKGQAVDGSRGVGIGLSICKTIIRAHGGTIEGYNRKEGGAKFVFRLPLQEEE